MPIPHYLAVTQGEFAGGALPSPLGYLGCHFSEAGLSGLPEALPPKSLLILDDRIPMTSQDPALILSQLQRALDALDCMGLLLDFQQPENGPQRALARLLSEKLGLPVAAPPFYAAPECRLFLPPVPPDQTVLEALSPWSGRKIWLDTAPGCVRLTLTKQGCARASLPHSPGPGKFTDAGLCCRYTIEKTGEGFQFTLFRDEACILAMLEQAVPLGVELAVGLYQELGAKTTPCGEANFPFPLQF